MLRVEMKPGATVRHMRPGAISSRLWASEASTSGWRTTRARGGREQPEAARRPCRQRQCQVSVPAAGRMVVDADAVEARVLAAGDERRDVGQGPADRNPEGDAEPGHLTKPPHQRIMLHVDDDVGQSINSHCEASSDPAITIDRDAQNPLAIASSLRFEVGVTVPVMAGAVPGHQSWHSAVTDGRTRPAIRPPPPVGSSQ